MKHPVKSRVLTPCQDDKPVHQANHLSKRALDCDEKNRTETVCFFVPNHKICSLDLWLWINISFSPILNACYVVLKKLMQRFPHPLCALLKKIRKSLVKPCLFAWWMKVVRTRTLFRYYLLGARKEKSTFMSCCPISWKMGRGAVYDDAKILPLSSEVQIPIASTLDITKYILEFTICMNLFLWRLIINWQCAHVLVW